MKADEKDLFGLLGEIKLPESSLSLKCLLNVYKHLCRYYPYIHLLDKNVPSHFRIYFLIPTPRNLGQDTRM